MSIWDFFKKKPQASADNAKGRLKLALVSDRTGCSPETMEKIKNDIIEVLAKYIDIDVAGLDINIENTISSETGEAAPTLLANIPIKEVKRIKKSESK